MDIKAEEYNLYLKSIELEKERKKNIELFYLGEEAALMDAIIVTSSLLGYFIEKNDNKMFKDVKIVKGGKDDPFNKDWIIVTLSKKTDRVIAAVTGRMKGSSIMQREIVKYSDSYDKSVVEVLKEVLTWI
ncbi:hypothetical protein D3C71_1076100 [compost metagenome]